MKNKKTIYTAVFISTFIAVLINLFSPDLFTLMFFNKIGENQLFTFGLIGLVVTAIIVCLLEKRKKR